MNKESESSSTTEDENESNWQDGPKAEEEQVKKHLEQKTSS